MYRIVNIIDRKDDHYTGSLHVTWLLDYLLCIYNVIEWKSLLCVLKRIAPFVGLYFECDVKHRTNFGQHVECCCIENGKSRSEFPVLFYQWRMQSRNSLHGPFRQSSKKKNFWTYIIWVVFLFEYPGSIKKSAKNIFKI